MKYSDFSPAVALCITPTFEKRLDATGMRTQAPRLTWPLVARVMSNVSRRASKRRLAERIEGGAIVHGLDNGLCQLKCMGSHPSCIQSFLYETSMKYE